MTPLPPWPLVLLPALARVVLVLLLLFGLLPAVMVERFPRRGSLSVAGRFVIFLFLAEVLVHLLAFLKLYEGLSVLGILAAALAWRYYFSMDRARQALIREQLTIASLTWIDRVTGGRNNAAGIAPGEALQSDPGMPRPMAASQARLLPPGFWKAHGPTLAVTAVILAVVLWMRFDGAFRHAAPAYSDSPVTLKWSKHFELGEPYVDGVYPQGMYAFLTILRKLSGENSLLVMLAAGPIVGVLMVAAVALFVRWSTGSALAAAAAGLLYGTLPGLTPMEFDRHVAHNSQEFGLIFVLPAAWFAFAYLKEREVWFAWAAAAAAGVAVFTHPLSGGLAVGFVAAACAAAILTRNTTWARLRTLVALCFGACAVAVAPLAVGLGVKGLHWHSTSLEFMSAGPPPFPDTPPWPSVVLVGLSALAPLLVPRERRAGVWCALAMVGGGLMFWYLPHLNLIPGIRTLGFRSGESGGLALGLAAGLACLALQELLSLQTTLRRHIAWLGPALLAVTAGTAWALVPPAPLDPPRISSDEIVQQMVRLDRNLTNGDWLLVMDSELGYSVAYSRGHHQYPARFLADSVIGQTFWCWVNRETGELGRGDRNVAIFLDKRDDRHLPLKRWVDAHRNVGLPLSAIYESATLDVWLLSYPVDPKERFEQIWDQSKPNCHIDPIHPSTGAAGGGPS